MYKTQTYEWCRRFKRSRTSVEDNEHLEQPSSGKIDENIFRVRKKNSRLSTDHQISENLGLTNLFKTCQ